jgi:hypothetical protein
MRGFVGVFLGCRRKFYLNLWRICGTVRAIEYNKGIDEEEYILSKVKRGSGWCKLS